MIMMVSLKTQASLAFLVSSQETTLNKVWMKTLSLKNVNKGRYSWENPAFKYLIPTHSRAKGGVMASRAAETWLLPLITGYSSKLCSNNLVPRSRGVYKATWKSRRPSANLNFRKVSISWSCLLACPPRPPAPSTRPAEGNEAGQAGWRGRASPD